jgi:hypothetical protein
MAGSGAVRMENRVTTGMHCQLVSSNLIYYISILVFHSTNKIYFLLTHRLGICMSVAHVENLNLNSKYLNLAWANLSSV